MPIRAPATTLASFVLRPPNMEPLEPSSAPRPLWGAMLALLLATGCDDAMSTPVDAGVAAPDAQAEADAGPLNQSDAGAPCETITGTLRDQAFEFDSETRAYFLHVPSSVRCDEPAPLWVHFHGTAGGRAEEAFRLDAMMRIADREGVILLRPRSRSRDVGGDFVIHQWDIHPGDLELNVRFVRALVDDLRERYAIDASRVYGSGFSSGANMLSQFLDGGEPGFIGFGFIGGGTWSRAPIGDLRDETRVYGSTGYRDYLHSSWVPLRRRILEAGLDASRLFDREGDTGHEMYGWHLEELFAWVDRGERPDPGMLDERWEEGAGPEVESSLLAMADGPDGARFVTTVEGTIWRQSADGWAEVARVGTPDRTALTDLCIGADGVGMVVGDGLAARTEDSGLTFERLSRTIPEYPEPRFGSAQFNGVGCAAGPEIIAAGYWTGNRTSDAGRSWEPVPVPNRFDFTAQVAALAVGDDGSAVAVGYYDYVGVRPAGEVAFVPTAHPREREWYNDVVTASGGRYWVVGEAGTVYRSVDSGGSWEDVSIDTSEDLYAVDFADDGFGLAVGSHGAAFLTFDGGDTWDDVSIGLDRTLADVRVQSPNLATVIGEAGLYLELSGIVVGEL